MSLVGWVARMWRASMQEYERHNAEEPRRKAEAERQARLRRGCLQCGSPARPYGAWSMHCRRVEPRLTCRDCGADVPVERVRNMWERQSDASDEEWERTVAAADRRKQIERRQRAEALGEGRADVASSFLSWPDPPRRRRRRRTR